MFLLLARTAGVGGVLLTIHAPSTRRDRRHVLRPGAGVVEIPRTASTTAPLSAALTKISAAGVAFVLETPVAGLRAGSSLSGVQLRVGECVLRGDISIRDVRALDGAASEIGGVFLPASREVETRLMALLAGIGAAEPD